MNRTNTLSKIGLFAILLTVLTLAGCKKDDDLPDEENEVEVITDVKLIFTNVNDAADVVEARAEDPDGEGVQELSILDEITLETNKTYTLTFEIFNNLESPGEDIGLEILEEDVEHQLFFSFSEDAFADPLGNGNIDNASDPVVYGDTDANGNPVGLTTTWSTPSDLLSGGSFTVRLQHQPDVKTATSDANTGDTDFDLEFVLNIE